MLVRDVAYHGILKELRADYHERFADWLEREAGERANEYEEILGYHLERAHRYLAELGPADERGRALAGRAATRLGSSGRRSLAREDIPSAVSLLERAVSLLPKDDPARRDLTLKLGIALAETGQLSRADALLHDRIEAERRGRASWCSTTAPGNATWWTCPRRSPRSPWAGGPTTTWRSRGTTRCRAGMRSWSVSPEGWMLSDDGSRNGSFRNGERITERRPLRDGDVLRFGDTVVLYRAPATDEDRRPIAEPDQVTSFGQSPTHGRESSEVDPE